MSDGFSYTDTFYEDINNSGVSTLFEYFNLVKNWKKQTQRSTSGQNYSDVDDFEQSRSSFHEMGNDPNNLGPYLEHLKTAFSKRIIPTFAEWQVTILHFEGFPAKAENSGNEITRYVTHFNRLLTAHYPPETHEHHWRLTYQMWNLFTKQIEEHHTYAIPTGSTNPGGILREFVHEANTLLNKLAPPQHSNPNNYIHPITKHPGDGMNNHSVCQLWEPGNVNTWSLLGWYKYYNIMAWNPEQTAMSGSAPKRKDNLSDTYNKTRAFHSEWQLLAWMVLYDKTGKYNEEAAKWALAPGRMPRRDVQDIYDATHWTRTHDTQRLIIKQNKDNSVSFVPDTKDAMHWRTYDDCPFSHYMLYDIRSYYKANKDETTDVFGGEPQFGTAFTFTQPRGDEYGSVNVSKMGAHLLGAHVRPKNPDDDMFPHSLKLNDPKQFETRMNDVHPETQRKVLQLLVRGFASILTLYHDKYPGQMNKPYFVTDGSSNKKKASNHPILSNNTKSVVAANKFLLKHLQSRTGLQDHMGQLLPEIAGLFAGEKMNDSMNLYAVLEMLMDQDQLDELADDTDRFQLEMEARLQKGATEVEQRRHPFERVVKGKWDPSKKWAVLGGQGRNGVFRRGEAIPIEVLLKDTGYNKLDSLSLPELKKFAAEQLPRSDMTVYQFLNSPYNCVYLPLVQTNSVIEDMESISPVCTRCVRPFFESQWVYAVWGVVLSGHSNDAKIINAVKPGRAPKGSTRRHKVGDDCGQPFDVSMEKHKEGLKLKRATGKRREFALVGNQRAAALKMKRAKKGKTPKGAEDKVFTAKYAIVGPVYSTIPEELYFFWDIEDKRGAGLVYTRYANYMHPDVKDPMNLMKTKGHVGTIDQGYIRQNDFADNAGFLVYNKVRMGFAFCQKLHLERVNDRSNICMDCYNELGGDGRKGMNLIMKPFSHKIIANPRLFKNQDIVDEAKREGNPSFQPGVGTVPQSDTPPVFEKAPKEEFAEAMKVTPLKNKADKRDCDNVESRGESITARNYWKNIECLTTKALLLQRLWHVETQLEMEDQINSEDFAAFRDRIIELSEKAPLKEPAPNEDAVIPPKHPQVIVPGSFHMRPPQEAPPKDQEEAAEQYRSQSHKNKQQAKINLDRMNTFVGKLTRMSDTKKNIELRSQLANELPSDFDGIKHLLRHLLVQLRIEEATTQERMTDNAFPNVFDHEATRIEIRNNKAYPGPLLGRTIRYPKLRFNMLKLIHAHTAFEEIGGQKVFTVQNGEFDYESFVDEDEDEGPSVRDHPLKYVRFFLESGDFGTQGGVHFVGMIDRAADNSALEHEVQERTMKMTHVFITYVLHKRAVNTEHNREVLSKMSEAGSYMFNTSQHLATMLDFGKMLKKDSDGNWDQVNIGNAHKASNVDNHPASYPNDTFTSHLDHYTWQGGTEIGPFHHFFHFHATLKLVHFSKLMFNYFTMRDWLRRAFQGLTPNKDWYLVDLDGRPMYRQSEVPHIDIQLLPQDGWDKVISNYLWKDAEDRKAREQAGVGGGLGAGPPGFGVGNTFPPPPPPKTTFGPGGPASLPDVPFTPNRPQTGADQLIQQQRRYEQSLRQNTMSVGTTPPFMVNPQPK